MSTFCVGNPLPLARHLVVSITTDLTPTAVIDQHGRRYPTQMHRDDYGPTLLVGLYLGAHESVELTPLAATAADVQWEVDEKTIDNGRVRAELDARGQVVRLCWDGVFADLTGPAVIPHIDGQLLQSGDAVITVHERGPVRATIHSTRTATNGVLDVTYTLFAHGDGLVVTASWNGSGELTLDHATAHCSAQLYGAGQGARIRAEQPITHNDLRWAALDDAAGRGTALIAGQLMRVSAQDGVLRLHGDELDYALHHARRDPEAHSLGQLAVMHGVPGRKTPSANTAPFHLAELGGLVPIDATVPEDWAGELVFSEQAGARGRAFIFPHFQALSPVVQTVREAWRVDEAGTLLSTIPLTREGDGLEVDYRANESFAVRWR